MKLTIVTKKTPNNSFEIKELYKAGLKYQLETKVINPKTYEEAEKELSEADIIIWRGADFAGVKKNLQDKVKLLSSLHQQGKLIINQTLFKDPFLSFKSFQQFRVSELLKNSVNTIPTFTPKTKEDLEKLINKKLLTFPIIAKPDYGSQGKGVILIEKREDIEKIKNFKEYIFQPFIENSGDYRIVVVGGVAIAGMKRVRDKNKVVNNIAQGGKALPIEDKKKEYLFKIAAKIATTLNLTIAGVDIIFDTKEKKFYFMEVNTIFNWEGLQKLTPFNIAEKIIKTLITIKKTKIVTPGAVEDYFLKRIQFLSESRQIHLLSRIYLFKKTLPKKYLQISENLLLKKTITIDECKEYEKKLVKSFKINQNFRAETIEKYPTLLTYSKLMLYYLWRGNLFNKPLQNKRKLLDKKRIVDLQNKLLSNPSDITIISTYAVNFLYLVKKFFPKHNRWNPEKLFELIKNENNPKIPDKQLAILKAYAITHIIICESDFYSKEIKNKKRFLPMLKFVEELIKRNFFDLSLHIKLEFLLCCKLLNYNSNLEQIILSEIKHSKSDHGNYIIDKFNFYKTSIKKSLETSEHRNVLYLMISYLNSQKQ